MGRQSWVLPLYANGGLAYYIQPPFNFTDALLDPIKTTIYIAFVLGSCAVFYYLIEISGTSPRDVAKQFKEQGLVIAGHRDTSAYKELKKIIPIAAAFGGATIGALSVVCDLMGTLVLVRLFFWPSPLSMDTTSWL